MSRTTTNYGAIAASAPVNRQAALMRDGGGEHYETTLPPSIEHWRDPPPAERQPSRDLPRLEGRVFGDGMRVVRYHGKRWNGARWLVRCPCGDYELRSTQAVTTAQADHRCAICSRTRSLALTLDQRRNAPAWKSDKPPTFKMKWTEAELRFALDAAEGRTLQLSPVERANLAARIHDRLSGLDQGEAP